MCGSPVLSRTIETPRGSAAASAAEAAATKTQASSASRQLRVRPWCTALISLLIVHSSNMVFLGPVSDRRRRISRARPHEPTPPTLANLRLASCAPRVMGARHKLRWGDAQRRTLISTWTPRDPPTLRPDWGAVRLRRAEQRTDAERALARRSRLPPSGKGARSSGWQRRCRAPDRRSRGSAQLGGEMPTGFPTIIEDLSRVAHEWKQSTRSPAQ